MKTLSLQFLAECFDLDREAGVLRWKVRPRHHFPTERGWRQSNGKFAGKVAGTISATTGYVVVNFLHSPFVVHRIIWAMEHGRWPKYIDHRDGDRTNNRPDNLRECSRSQNQCNRSKQANNTSGFKGVHERPRGKWAASGRQQSASVAAENILACSSRPLMLIKHIARQPRRFMANSRAATEE